MGEMKHEKKKRRTYAQEKLRGKGGGTSLLSVGRDKVSGEGTAEEGKMVRVNVVKDHAVNVGRSERRKSRKE